MPLKICLCKIHDFNLASVAFFHNSEHLSSFNGFVSSHCAYFLKVHNINNLCAITFQIVFPLSPHACFHYTSVLFDLCSSSHTYFHYACLLKGPQSLSLAKSPEMKALNKTVQLQQLSWKPAIVSSMLLFLLKCMLHKHTHPIISSCEPQSVTVFQMPSILY